MRNRNWQKKLYAVLTALMVLAATAGFSISAMAATSIEAANIRGAASTEGNLLGVLYPGQEATILGEVTGSDGTTWYRIEVVTAEGITITGYVKGSLMTNVDEEVQEEPAQEPEEEVEPPPMIRREMWIPLCSMTRPP